VSISLRIDRFDTGIAKETLFESVTETISDILGFPGLYLWTLWASKNLSNIIEWLVFIGNSMIWGIVLAYFYTFAKQHITSQSSSPT